MGFRQNVFVVVGKLSRIASDQNKMSKQMYSTSGFLFALQTLQHVAVPIVAMHLGPSDYEYFAHWVYHGSSGLGRQEKGVVDIV
jgi:hypothetical protein